ncbi:FKBP-type peptidyl-prolyl cis-trans isomerase [Niabella sp. CJ426]|jgi:FKBP-type peptidyl-prolyl cis-trans isomerase FkpA|uniref:FKBP-type peptidyl-prolyl cis-trans isomerase n=1 Tax=Niabella sp. CJ426 TaxID=3393740 RepID=UPI003D030FFA
MKKRFWLPVAAVVTALALTACLKNNDDDIVRCTPYSLQRDQQAIDSIIGSELDSYTFDTQNSLYYRINNPGEGEGATTNDSLVAFNYVGRLLNSTGTGAIVDSLTIKPPATNNLSYYARLIVASYALPKIKEGGSISVIIPSSQLFGCQEANGVNRVPPNSQLIYTYNLTDVRR